MTWQAAAAFLACARIGAIHSAVFAGFSAESLRDRVDDCQSRVLITTDEGKRGGKTIATKASKCLLYLAGVVRVRVCVRDGRRVEAGHDTRRAAKYQTGEGREVIATHEVFCWLQTDQVPAARISH